MKLLLDTHAFLFAIGEPTQLSSRARDLLADPAIERWVSTISLWEIAVKAATGKLSVSTDRGFFIRHIDALRAKVLAVDCGTRSHCLSCRSITRTRSTGC